MTRIVPARLHMLFASDAPIGVVLRQGPSKEVRLILWHTDTDTFELGQWLKGTIAEWSVSLSPDGKLLGYCASDYRLRRPNPTLYSSWVAISRPPYLTALLLWFAQWGITSFPNNRTFAMFPTSTLAEGYVIPSAFRVRELPARWDYLRARGWHAVPGTENPDGSFPGLYTKRIGTSNLLLELHLRQFRPESYTLYDGNTGIRISLEASYAEIDPGGRLVVAHQGKLFAVTVETDGTGMTVTRKELADFNEMRFEPVAPPDWARQWPL